MQETSTAPLTQLQGTAAAFFFLPLLKTGSISNEMLEKLEKLG